MDSKTQQSCSSSTYDVFLSFRGEDTRRNFTDHLHNALVQAGIETYRDDDKLQRGEAICPELMKAIENSRISIPVFSRNYASSRWCLQELAKIMECRESIGQTVLPIFLDGASPSDVRKQIRGFEDAFTSHGQRFEKEMVERWSKAMREATELSGWVLKEVADGHESKLVQLVVKTVLGKLNNTPLDVAKYPVDINSRVEDMMGLLNVKSEGIQYVGIYGMGGIGKTTIAKALYNRIFSNFDGNSFLADVAEAASQLKGLVYLQNQLLDDILKTEHKQICSVSQGKMLIKERLRAKKVLLILDNVNDQCQLDALAGRNWFGFGSRIIITTRDEHLLKVFHVEEIYRPKEMDFDQSLQLFCKHAFGRDQPLKGYRELSKNVVDTAGGLPLALEVLGSLPFGERRPEEWESVVKKLGKFSRKQVQQKLKISYDVLDDEEKDMFLDIACFFIGMDKELVLSIWEGCNFSSWLGLEGLVHKSLVRVGDNNELRMHDQLRDMGREIVRQENPKDPRMRSRLWIHEEVLDMLKKPMGTINVEGLLVNFKNRQSSSEEVNLNIKAFASMPKLRLLQLDNTRFEVNLEHLPKTLRWLCWKGCPFKSLPTNFRLENLAVLDLSQSMITKIWSGWHQNELFENLKVLNLSYCHYLIRTPDFSGLLGLERLILEGCVELVEVHETIGYLQKLVFLNLRCCSKLNKLPENLGALESLKELLLDHTAIEQLHNSIGDLKNLTRLSLRGCRSLEKIPNSVWRIESLIYLTLCAKQIKEIPDAHTSLRKLEVLHIENCGLFDRVLDWIVNVRNLTSICITGSTITKLPDVVGSLEKLEKLNVSNCEKLVKLPVSMGKLRLLRYFNMGETGIVKLPHDFGLLSSLEELEMVCCREFEGFPDNFGSLAQLKIIHTQYNSKLTMLPTTFPGLCSLKELNARGCNLGTIPWKFGKLSKLETLELGYNDFSTLPISICDLSQLRRLCLEGCSKLEFLPKLPSSLIEINAKQCILMRSLPNLSNLTNLQELCLSNCCNLITICGLERLESLRGLYMSGCRAIENKRESLVQGVFEHLSYFTLSGSEIPEWFMHHTPSCEVSSRCDGEITGVILCIVLMLMKTVPAEQYPFDASKNMIYINIEVWRNGRKVFSSQTSMDGISVSNDDQIYLCHFREEDDDFVSALRSGDQIRVAKIFIPKFKELHMKKCGIHVVYKPTKGLESQDSQRSVYGRLVDFFNSLDVGDCNNNGFVASTSQSMSTDLPLAILGFYQNTDPLYLHKSGRLFELGLSTERKSMEGVLSNQVREGEEEEDEEQLLPLGFSFKPSDEELISYYLRTKVLGIPVPYNLVEHDVYEIEPWKLAANNRSMGENELYFFTKRPPKHRDGKWKNRSSRSGYWKVASADKKIYSKEGGELIGFKKTLVYHNRNATETTKRDWIMHEYSLCDGREGSSRDSDEWVICHIKYRGNHIQGLESEIKSMPDRQDGDGARPSEPSYSATVPSCSTRGGTNTVPSDENGAGCSYTAGFPFSVPADENGAGFANTVPVYNSWDIMQAGPSYCSMEIPKNQEEISQSNPIHDQDCGFEDMDCDVLLSNTSMDWDALMDDFEQLMANEDHTKDVLLSNTSMDWDALMDDFEQLMADEDHTKDKTMTL